MRAGRPAAGTGRGEDARGAQLLALPPPAVARAEVMDELADAVLLGRAPLHSGAWGLATTEVCLAMLESSRTGLEVALLH